MAQLTEAYLKKMIRQVLNEEADDAPEETVTIPKSTFDRAIATIESLYDAASKSTETKPLTRHLGRVKSMLLMAIKKAP